MKNQIDVTDVNAVSVAIGIPKDEWKGNCHTISYQILDKGLVEGHLERGHYYGIIAKGSLFDRGCPIVPHSWIRLADGSIYDPTRFAFEGNRPYIFISDNYSEFDEAEYDVGGCRLRSLKPLPPFDETKKKMELNFKTKECEEFIFSLLNYPPFLTITEVFYIANYSFQSLGEHAYELYKALEESNNDAFVPLDSWEYVMKTHHKR